MFRAKCKKCSGKKFWKVRRGKLRCQNCLYEFRPKIGGISLSKYQWKALLKWFLRCQSANVVCDVNPEIKNSGFELKLDNELPARSASVSNLNYPWILILENNAKCTILTGTAVKIGDEVAYYPCDNESLIIGDLIDKKPLWKADVVDLNSERHVIKKESLIVIKAWR